MQDTIFVNQKPYTVVRLLGHGKGGYSYLVEENGCQYVLKQIHHEPCEYYSFGNKIEAEINDYNRLLQTGIRLPRMLDVDIENERIVKEYIDEAISGTTDEREAFEEMMSDVHGSPEWDMVVVYDLSRFSRDMEHSVVYSKELELCNV